MGERVPRGVTINTTSMKASRFIYRTLARPGFESNRFPPPPHTLLPQTVISEYLNGVECAVWFVHPTSAATCAITFPSGRTAVRRGKSSCVFISGAVRQCCICELSSLVCRPSETVWVSPLTEGSVTHGWPGHEMPLGLY